MNEIETILSDFRKMAESLKHLRVELLWVTPENGDVMYVYKWCVLLGIFNVEDWTKEKNQWTPQLHQLDWWKFVLQVEIEEAYGTSIPKSTEAFGNELCTSCGEMCMDALIISDWVSKHPEIPWYRIEDEEEGDEE